MRHTLTLYAAAAATLAAVSCARMGQPDGGWYDVTPPKVIGATPQDRATGVTERKVSILFDEFIKVEDAQSKVVVSPPQIEQPEIKAQGKQIRVELKDTLMKGQTYTIDFSDAITDNNEGNPLGRYTYSFSTGTEIDSLEVSGAVITADDLEPVKGILVGLYAEQADSAFTTQPMLRVARTDGSGRFTIKGVAPGTYRIYGLMDQDGDYRYSQRGEMAAFTTRTVTPSFKPDIRQDTVWRDSLHIDSIARVPYTHYLPDDITLLAFTARQTDRYLLKTERKDERYLTAYFTYTAGQMPQLRGLDFPDSLLLAEPSPQRDTINYWILDTTLVSRDTLTYELTYLTTDTAGALQTNRDTIQAIAKTPHAKRLKELQKKADTWTKKQARLKKKGEHYDSIMPPEPLKIRIEPTAPDPDSRLAITLPTPPLSLDTAAIHLYVKQDTLWYEQPYRLQADTATRRRLHIASAWQTGAEYSLEIDSAAIADVYGAASPKIKQGLKVPAQDEYGTLAFRVTGADRPADITLELTTGQQTLRTAQCDSRGQAKFEWVKPGKYYVRALDDRNHNRQWDTGDYDTALQPEDVYYYPKEIETKAKWDITLDWDLQALPRHLQKPSALVKQKEDTKTKRRTDRNIERAKKLGLRYLGIQY